MSSLDDIVTIVEFHRRRWKPPASLTKSLRVAGSLVFFAFIFISNIFPIRCIADANIADTFSVKMAKVDAEDWLNDENALIDMLSIVII